MAEKKVKIGIVGLGNMGSGHIQHLSEIADCKLAACCDIIPEKAEKFGRQYGIPYYTDAVKMFKSGKIEAVVLAVPHYDHTTLAVKAFDCDLHVLTEKPVGVHKNDVLKMIKAHKKHPDKVFAAMFQMRLWAPAIRLRELIRRGELGRIQRVHWTITNWFRSQAYYDSGTWRATWKGEGGGVLLNQCPHNLDLFQWFFGMPKTVRANCAIGKYHKIEVEDEVTAYLEYEDGATATFITSTGEAPGTNRLEIACDRGRVVMEGGEIHFTRNEIPTEEFLNTTDSLFGYPATWEINVPIFSSYGTHSHKTVLENFVSAILHGTELIAPAEEGLNSVELGNAMLYSSMNDCTVQMPLDGAKYEKMLKKLIADSKFKKAEARGGSVDMSASFGK